MLSNNPATRLGNEGDGSSSESDEEDLFAVYSDVLAANLRLVGRRFTTVVSEEDVHAGEWRHRIHHQRTLLCHKVTHTPHHPLADHI